MGPPSELLCRYLGGDLSFVDEVCRMRSLQEELAVQRPEDPCRFFGLEVEAASGSTGGAGSQLLRVCTMLQERIAAQIDERLAAYAREQAEALARIQERLDEDRQRVNLNVRCPKGAATHQPPITRNIVGAGRPFPVARFLDEMERVDTTWKAARKSFAPTFSMVTQVLKKNKLRGEGAQPIYVEQNHREQLLYTEDDRALMLEAWELTAAHREELAGRPGNPQAAPMMQDRVSVMDMLRGRE